MSTDLDHARSFVMGLDLPAPRFGAAAAPSAPINFDAARDQALVVGSEVVSFVQGVGTVQGNEELGLDMREVLGVGLGRFVVQTGHNEWSAVAGLAGVRENFQSEETQNSLEGVIGTEYSYFRYDTPKRSVDLGLAVFPSLTQSGRVRAEAQLESRFEIVKDLFFEVSGYGSYDSDADPSAPSNTDYGVVTSLGYSF